MNSEGSRKPSVMYARPVTDETSSNLALGLRKFFLQSYIILHAKGRLRTLQTKSQVNTESKLKLGLLSQVDRATLPRLRENASVEL